MEDRYPLGLSVRFRLFIYLRPPEIDRKIIHSIVKRVKIQFQWPRSSRIARKVKKKKFLRDFVVCRTGMCERVCYYEFHGFIVRFKLLFLLLSSSFFFSAEDFAIIFLRYFVDCVSPSPSVIVVVIFRFRALYNNFTLLFVAGFAVGVLSIRVSSITRSIIEIQTLFL